MTTIEALSFSLMITFVFLGIVFSIFPLVRHKQEYPKYKQSGRKYKLRTNHYARRK